MNEAAMVTGGLLAGLALGGFFFGGLWWTVKRSIFSRWPALWLAGSLLFRGAGTIFGFYAVARNDWRRWAACLVGFIAARSIVGRLTAVPPIPPLTRVEGEEEP